DERPAFFEAEKFRARFHQPKQVEKMLKDTASAPEEAAVPNMLPPEVQIVSVSTAAPKAGEDVVVEVLVKQRGDAYVAQPSRVTLWVNDYLVQDVKLALEDRQEAVTTKITVPYKKLREGDNVLVAQAYNKEGIRDDDRLLPGETAGKDKRRIIRRA